MFSWRKCETSDDGSASSFLCPLQPIEFDESRRFHHHWGCPIRQNKEPSRWINKWTKGNETISPIWNISLLQPGSYISIVLQELWGAALWSGADWTPQNLIWMNLITNKQSEKGEREAGKMKTKGGVQQEAPPNRGLNPCLAFLYIIFLWLMPLH